jgi:hypothetical protein
MVVGQFDPGSAFSALPLRATRRSPSASPSSPPSEIAQHARGACQREGAMAGPLTRGWRGEARSTALQTRPQAWASSSAINEARAERDVHCALISAEAQGDGAVRIEPRMRAPQIGGSRSRLILMRGCRGGLVIDRLLLAGQRPSAEGLKSTRSGPSPQREAAVGDVISGR